MTDRTPTPPHLAPDDEAPPVSLDALPRTLWPSDTLEHAVVQALCGEGLLGPRARRRRGPRVAARGWLAAAAAAGLALFAGGFALGQAAGGRATLETLEAVAALRDGDEAERAALLQRTGSLGVRAVTGLDEAEDAGPGREVALAILRAAATELARLSPDDARLARVRAILEGSEAEAGPGVTRSVLWF